MEKNKKITLSGLFTAAALAVAVAAYVVLNKKSDKPDLDGHPVHPPTREGEDPDQVLGIGA